MRVLLTGAAGFVGPYVVDALAGADPNIEIISTAHRSGEHPALGALLGLDITSPEDVSAALDRYKPTHIVNLAGIAAPTVANADSRQTWRIHVDGVLTLARAIAHQGGDSVLVNVGSGLIYGGTAAKVCPLTEESLLDPQDEYSATKAAADLALGALARKGLKCLRMRPFNHTGTGQTTAFVVPSFAMQIARIEAGLEEPKVRVGNLEAERDFLDVRDVAASYARAVLLSNSLKAGTILNIASGTPRRMSDILDALIAMSSKKIAVELDPARLRPSDLPRVVGDASRARELLDWQPRHDFEDTLKSVLDDCRRRVAESA